jgi:hypothetical protein
MGYARTRASTPNACAGDSFGVTASSEPQFHRGEMRALVDDCQFVLVAQADFVRIMNAVDEHLQKNVDEKSGEIVSEMERRFET